MYGTSYFSVIPTNLYGTRDNFHLENSHVIPAMIRKYRLSKLAMVGDLDGFSEKGTPYAQSRMYLLLMMLLDCFQKDLVYYCLLLFQHEITNQ
ncbi:MAG: GDP-L-fucose synthase [Desulforhopalus sp.]|jgi:GDP-L-fucose synthase